MIESVREPAPIAVVALGDPAHRDDGVALRVMGRVRTLIGELGCTRNARAMERAGSGRDRASLALVSSARPAGRIDWIEGGTDANKLDSFLGGRKRVVLMDAVRVSGKVGQVHHWHLRCLPESRLSVIRRFNSRSTLGLEHLALWLEDELPEGGTDLIGIEPQDLSEGEGLSRSVRQRLPAISAQVAAILVRLLDEEGW